MIRRSEINLKQNSPSKRILNNKFFMIYSQLILCQLFLIDGEIVTNSFTEYGNMDNGSMNPMHGNNFEE